MTSIGRGRDRLMSFYYLAFATTALLFFFTIFRAFSSLTFKRLNIMCYDELMPKVQNQHDTQSSHNDYFVFTYSLANLIGCEAAMVLSKIEYWINVSGKDLIGREGKWICNSYESWQKQFPNLSYYKIKKIFKTLEKDGFIISTKANTRLKDQTKWYTMVKEKFEQYKHIKNADKSMKQGASPLIENQRMN